MIVVPLKEGESIERALKKFKRKFEKTGVVKELRRRQAFTKPSVEKKERTYSCDLRAAITASRRVIIRFFTPFFGLIKKSPYIRRIKTMRRECFY